MSLGRLYEKFHLLSTLDNYFAVMRALILPRGLLRTSNTSFPTFSSVPWTCQRCLSSLRKPQSFPTIKTRSTPAPRRGGKIILSVVGGTAVGAAAFGVAPDVGHTVAAVERAGRVASALALCINECVCGCHCILGELGLIACRSYRITLKILEHNPENETLLSKCHKRCAER